MNNICRPFILYNDFLPPKAEVHQEWQYLSFGDYDGVTVGDNLFEENICDFGCLWEYYIKQGGAMNGSFSFQIFWGVRCDEEEEYEYDKGFWGDEGVEYPFLFITLLQINRLGENFVLDRMKRTNLEKSLTERSKRKAITYLTLDNSDLILVLRCKNYQDGADAINSLHYSGEELELNYSYTVASVNRAFLSDNQRIDAAAENVSHAYIHVIEKKPGSISCIYEKIKKDIGEEYEINKEAIPGCSDEIIVMKDIPWSKFLKLFQDVTGLLNHSNQVYEENITGVTTIIGEDQKSKEYNSLEIETQDGQTIEGGEKTENELPKKSLSDVMREKCSKVENAGNSVRIEAVKRSIYQVINSLSKFENIPFTDYMFQTVFLPLNMVIDLAAEMADSSVDSFYDSFYEFKKGLNLYAQNSGHSDRQFTQTPDMNIRIYETPVKLNAFYNAFIHYLKQFLNELDGRQEEVEHEYEFLACPGVTNNMRVQELFRSMSDTKRLFLVEMPENQVYNPRMMLIMLAHEVAHFVGKSVRNRKERFEYAEQIAGKIIVKYFYVALKNYYKISAEEFRFIQNEFFWKRTEEVIVEKLREFSEIENYENYLQTKVFYKEKNEDENNEKMKDFLGYLRCRKEHSEVFRMILADGMTSILEEDDNGLWKYLWERDYLYWIEQDASKADEKRTELKLMIRDLVWKFSTEDTWNNRSISVWSTVGIMIDLFKECIADLAAILTLRLSVSDYFETILRSRSDQEFDTELEQSVLLLRSGLVTGCMLYADSGQEGMWTESMLSEIMDAENENMRQLGSDVRVFQSTYLNGRRIYEEAECDTENGISNDLEADMFYDTDNLKLILRYLLKSKEIFLECTIGEGGYFTSERQRRLCEMYNLFAMKEIDELTIKMQEHIADFLEEIEQRNEQYANDYTNGK